MILGSSLAERGETIDFGELALKCLTHDIEESIMCDIPRNVKYGDEAVTKSLKAMEASTIQKLSETSGFKELEQFWSRSKDATIEGYIVKLSDMIHVIKKCVEEVEYLGNKHFLRVVNELPSHLEGVAAKIRDESTISTIARDYILFVIEESQSILNFIKSDNNTSFEKLGIDKLSF